MAALVVGNGDGQLGIGAALANDKTGLAHDGLFALCRVYGHPGLSGSRAGLGQRFSMAGEQLLIAA